MNCMGSDPLLRAEARPPVTRSGDAVRSKLVCCGAVIL